MNLAEPDLETQVRQLADVGLSTRRIAEVIGDVSQSTVVRVLQRINTGPQPLLKARKTWSKRLPAIMEGVRLGALVLLSVSVTVLAAAVATIAWT